mmetsp:Transcript_26669/g.58616  ORF Transcript_26669/g.58616 Transcript_26669/m.58616 type:complete len:294 (-) Transcript_26669:1689-2570(-)
MPNVGALVRREGQGDLDADLPNGTCHLQQRDAFGIDHLEVLIVENASCEQALVESLIWVLEGEARPLNGYRHDVDLASMGSRDLHQAPRPLEESGSKQNHKIVAPLHARPEIPQADQVLGVNKDWLRHLSSWVTCIMQDHLSHCGQEECSFGAGLPLVVGDENVMSLALGILLRVFKRKNDVGDMVHVIQATYKLLRVFYGTMMGGAVMLQDVTEAGSMYNKHLAVSVRHERSAMLPAREPKDGLAEEVSTCHTDLLSYGQVLRILQEAPEIDHVSGLDLQVLELTRLHEAHD